MVNERNLNNSEKINIVDATFSKFQANILFRMVKGYFFLFQSYFYEIDFIY